MSEVFVARQPIFNRRLEVAGYELLFRAGAATEAIITSPEGSTATVVLNSFTEIGLDRIVGSQTAWINVSREFVLSGLAASLPAHLVLLEILEDQAVDAPLRAALEVMKASGYRLALDDFHFGSTTESLLDLADVVKLDVLALGREVIAETIDRLRPLGTTTVAEKVETAEDYAYCAGIGCDLFQGYFFCRPEIVRGRAIDANRLAVLELLSALQDPTVDLAALERLIARDVALSYRLLRYINSAFFGLRHEVRSISQALALLGVERLVHWAALNSFTSIPGKPAELAVTALVRARFCELAGDTSTIASPAELFTLGLFSVIDALMDAPMEDVLAQIPFPEDTRAALIGRKGAKGRLLECVTALEQARFDAADGLMRGAGEHYMAALAWANDASDPLLDTAAPAAATVAAGG